MILKLEKHITIELSLALICVLRRKDGIMDHICMDGYIYTNFDMERCWRRECFGRTISGTYENLLLYGKDHQKKVHEKIWKNAIPYLCASRGG